MATIQYGPGMAPSGYYGDTTVNGVANFLNDLPWLWLTTRTTTVFSGDYRYFGAPGVVNTFYGSGFTYDANGNPIGGTITEIKSTYAGQLRFDLTNVSTPVAQLNSWIRSGASVTAAQTIFGGNDVFIGTSGHEVLQGWGGTDTFYPGGGADTVIGGPGIDTVVLPIYAQYSVVGTPETSGSVSSGSVSVGLQAVDRIRFIDGTRYYDSDSPAAQVVRLYDTALGRAPDPVGLASWTNALGAGMSLTQMAAAFVASPEFQARYPGVAQSPDAFVTQLYQNTLHRTPDVGGLSGWSNGLRSGALSQAQVVVGFSQSTEHQRSLLAATDGVFVADETCASVARLYYTTLGRGPDAGGLSAWTNAVESGSKTLLQVAGDFTASREFQSSYGNLSNGDFVALMYRNTLGREADPAGYAAWSTALAGGGSRAAVVVGFSESPEHVQILSSRIDAHGVLFA